MSDTFRVSGGPPIAMDDGRLVRFGGTFDLDELKDDELLARLLDSGQVAFVDPQGIVEGIEDVEDEPIEVKVPLPPEGSEG
ncbi:hypothetical protein LCGC14_0592340 [marine sediment metagenome]|uniref:Uncharacterized protein n=1 Tax=marine sediment metagenome TaxID=412755 RepID=A0A0F9TZ75_9ZZZZ